MPARPLHVVSGTQPAGGTAPADESPGSGAEALDQVAAFIRRYVALPSAEALTAVALWAAHTWAMDAWYTTPRLVLDSAEPGSGKTRTLEVLRLLCRQPEMLFSATPAAIFRMLDEPLTLLFDELDTIFGPRAAAANGGNEDLRALLNAGYKRGATIPRCVGDGTKLKVQRFPVFAPVALAGLAGNMPDTITTRAVVVHMKRRAPGERVEPFRERDAEAAAEPLREALASWTAAVVPELADARPVLPDGVVDRPAEVWEPLVALADLAGGSWPGTSRLACRAFALHNDPAEGSLGIRLLADLRDLFQREDADRMTSADIVRGLVELDEAPWADLFGRPLDARRLARELGKYRVRSKDLKLPGGQVLKGYRTDGDDGLADAWSRYLPMITAPSATAATEATTPASPVALTLPVADPTATDQPSPPAAVAASAATAEPPATGPTSAVAEVAPVAPVIARQALPTDDGPCVRCGNTTRRYGLNGNALCAPCRTGQEATR